MKRRFIGILSSLPIGVHHFIADWLLFPLMYYIVRYRRRIVDKNLLIAFPDASEAERRALRKRFYHHFADVIVESLYGYRMTDEEFDRRVSFPYADQMARIIHTYGGAITLLAHLGTWEWMADLGRHMDEQGIYECNVYRKLKNKYFNQLMLDIRARRRGECTEKEVLLRRMLQLRNSERLPVYGMLSDQKPSPRSTQVTLEFFGHQTPFLNGSEVLGQKFGYPCFYGYIRSTARGIYSMQLLPLNVPEMSRPQFMQQYDLPEDIVRVITANDLSVTQKYVRLLERNIREQPELWLWSHNRWKYSNDL